MTLWQMSASGAVLVLVIAVLRALLLARLPKRTFVVLWDIALARLLLPLAIPFGGSFYALVRRGTQAAALVPTQTLAAVPTLPGNTAAGSTAETAALPHPAAQTAGVPVWALVWLTGVLVLAAFFAWAYWKSWQKFQMSLPVEQPFARQWLQSHPLRRGVCIRQSEFITSPLTFGVRRPVILLPKRTDWQDETTLQYVLEHEFVHIRRFDAARKLLLTAAVCVHWYNPLVWVLYRLANRDIELACDEAVLHRFGRAARADYARALIRMEETRSGFVPLSSGFSSNAMEERIVAIMKTGKTTVVSMLLAGALVVGTTTAFATSAPTKTDSSSGTAATAVESGTADEVSAEYRAIGISEKNDRRYYQGKAIAGIYDDNGGIYTNDTAADCIYLHIQRGSDGTIAEAVKITKAQFREMIDRYMNQKMAETATEEETILSYVNPDDGKTYYSFDDGKTFTPLTDAEYEKLYPTQDIEWWTYDEYKAWLDNEKVQLQSMLGEKGSVNGGEEFVWTQAKIDETIALYEEILQDLKNGMMYSKTVDGQDDMLVIYNPADREQGTAAITK